MKWAGALSGMARALDLYLALETAAQHYGQQGDAERYVMIMQTQAVAEAAATAYLALWI